MLYKDFELNVVSYGDLIEKRKKYILTIDQACQTGGPRAACGPIACPMRPAALIQSENYLNWLIFIHIFDLEGV